MSRGKTTCKVLKEVRRKIADANGIPLQERECTHTGDCAGTCPYCESEVRYLERELSKRKSLGKAVAVAGIAVAAVMPAMAQTPENANSATGPVKTAEQNSMGNEVQPKTCDTFPMPGIVPQSNSSSVASVDTVLIEYEMPGFEPDGMIIPSPRIIQHDVWCFPPEYGRFRSYLHQKLKDNPELRNWLKEKTKQKGNTKQARQGSSSGNRSLDRMLEREWRKNHRQFRKEEEKSGYSPRKDNYFLLGINKKGEVVDVRLEIPIVGEEDMRMYEAFYHVIDDMPRWTLKPKKTQPETMIWQQYPYRMLR